MHSLVDLPGHEQFVSAFVVEGDRLSIRFVSDFHPGSAAMAYVVSGTKLRDPGATAAFLQAVMDQGDHVYLTMSEGWLLIQREADDDSCRLPAATLTGRPEALNISELRTALDRVWAWRQTDHEASRALSKRLESIQSILYEQARRVELKSAAHPADSVAGVLYAQQMRMIHRLLEAARG